MTLYGNSCPEIDDEVQIVVSVEDGRMEDVR